MAIKKRCQNLISATSTNRGSSPCTGGRYPPARWQRPQKQSGNHQTHTQGKLPLPTFPIDNILRGDAPAPWAVFGSLGGRFMSTLRNTLLCWTEMAPVGSPEHASNQIHLSTIEEHI